MASEIEKFQNECKANISTMTEDDAFAKMTQDWMDRSFSHKYSYNFTWMGRPVIQYPQDIVAMQEILWEVKPDLIIETGVAHGGSLILYSSLLQVMGLEGEVLGIDIDIRAHNRVEIEAHPMFSRITLIEGSSVAEDVVAQVKAFAKDKKKIIVVLDSNHTHAHVLEELNHYASLVSKDSYLIVFDTLVEDLAQDVIGERPWGHGDNPKTAVYEFLKNNQNFVIDKNIQNKLKITVAPDGYIKRIS